MISTDTILKYVTKDKYNTLRIWLRKQVSQAIKCFVYVCSQKIKTMNWNEYTECTNRKKEKEDYLKCESDIRKSIKTFPFTLLYPLFVATKAKAVCLIAIKKEFIFPFFEITKMFRAFWTKLHFMVKRF